MKLGNKEVLIGIGIIFTLFFLIFFEFTGLRFILSFIIFFILPTYLLLSLFNFNSLEKLVYSFFIGMGIIPTLVYYPGLFISFRASMAIVFVAMLLIWFLVKKRQPNS